MKRRTSRWLSILLALCLALALLPGTAWAAASSSCGENVTWSYSGGTLTIQGTGRMFDYGGYMLATNGPHFFEDEENSVDTVVIGDGVTHIGGAAFRDFKSLTRVVIPNSVTSIGEAAFYRCRELTSVTIPDGVTEIGDYAFSYCESLTSVTIPGSVTFIGTSVFSDCSSLTSVTIPDGVTSIGASAFGFCESLADVYYGGNESQWERVDIDNTSLFMGGSNKPLLDATIHYNSAAPAPTASGSVSVTVNGKAVAWTDAAPFIDANDRTMVPLRAVADAMGLDVNWDAAAREASFTGSGKTIYFPIDSTNARTSSGGTVKMDTAAVIVNDRTYAPIRYLAEYFGYTVGWDAATRTVTITG